MPDDRASEYLEAKQRNIDVNAELEELTRVIDEERPLTPAEAEQFSALIPKREAALRAWLDAKRS
jgi:hypothetical protein